ncbi:MAG TPA: translocation/assembly module TamB domain-containing protein [Terriglobales bacterium]|nr:translocation/assembly module TamB domain-containing protein [Terriglobales bacterium]
MKWQGPWAKLGKSFLLFFLLVALAISSFLWYLTTDSFQQMARQRVIAELERATGGRVDLGSFHAVPLRLQVEVRDLTIHGKEGAGEQPFAHVDRLAGVINLSSALGAKLAFHSLILQHPVVHIIFYPDGSTNQPTTAQKSNSSDLEQLFSLSARRLEVHGGELVLQDQRIPLDFNSDDVSANLDYSLLHFRYSGNLKVGKIENQIAGFRPVTWTGQASFNFDRNGVQVQSLKAAADRSQIVANDVNFDFHSLKGQGRYQLNLDLEQLGAVTGRPQLKGGTLQASGDAAWSRQGLVSSGSFDVRGLALQDRNFSGRDVSAAGQFSIDPKMVALSRVEGQLLRGSFAGEAEVSNWQASPRAGKGQEQQGTIRVKTKNISLAELLTGLGPAFRPANKLRFAGNISGSGELRWKQSIQYAQLTADADVSPTARAEDRIPLAASIKASYNARSGDLQLNEFSAETSASQVRASGSLANAVRISFSSTDIDEWRPIISEFFSDGPAVHVHGHAGFNGIASGKGENLRLSGSLRLQDFDALLPATGQSSRQAVHWDSLIADGQASSTGIILRSAVLKREDAILRISGSADLAAWELAPDSALNLRIQFQNLEAAEFSSYAGYGADNTGKISGEFQLSGSRGHPGGAGNFSWVNGSIHGRRFDSAIADVSLRGTQVTIKNLRVSNADSLVTAAGSYDYASKAIQMDVRGTNFDLDTLTHPGPVKVTGKLDFNANATGTVSAPRVTADLEFRKLTLNGEEEGNFSLKVNSQGDNVSVTGRSAFRDAELQIDGKAAMHERWPAHLNFHFSHLNADPFFESYLHSRIIRHSLVAGDLTVDGPLRDPKQLKFLGSLTDVYSEAGKTSLRNDGPIQFALVSQILKIDRFRILGENTDFSGGGSLQLGDKSLDFQTSGKLDLKMLQSYDSAITSSGMVVADGRISGTLDAPLIKGQLQIQNGAISDINVPSALSDINGTLLFSQNQVTLQSLSAHVGGGTVGFTGHADLVGRQLNFDLNAGANSVRLRYPPGVSSTANAQLHWAGSSSGSLLSGDIMITKLAFTPGFDFGAYLERTAEISSLPQTDPVLNTIRLDLHVTTAPELQMQTSVIRLQGAADLRVRGSAAKPILLGRADVFEGQAYFNGTKYRLERGGVSFSNPAVTTPFLDLEAVTRIRDYDVTLSLTGDVSKPNGLKVNYRSDPPLPTNDIIALLAFGKTTEESATMQQTSQSAFNQQASSAMLAAALNATLNNRAQRLFGNSRIKIDPQGLESETSTITQSGPAVTIEQQVKENLTLSYTTDVSQTSQQVIRGEYNVSKNISIVAIRDQNGVVSFDVKIRRRKR